MLSVVIAKKEFAVIRENYIAANLSSDWQENWEMKTFAREVFKADDVTDLLQRERYLCSAAAERALGEDAATWMATIVSAHLDYLHRLNMANKPVVALETLVAQPSFLTEPAPRQGFSGFH